MQESGKESFLLVGLNVSTPIKYTLDTLTVMRKYFSQKIVHNFADFMFANLRFAFVNLELKKQKYFVYFMNLRCTKQLKPL